MIRLENECINNFIHPNGFYNGIVRKNIICIWENGEYGQFIFSDYSIDNFQCYFKRACVDKEKKTLLWEIENQDSTIMGIGFVVGFCFIRCAKEWQTFESNIESVNDVFESYYRIVRKSVFAHLSDNNFKKIFLQKENEHYLYTKKNLFPFFTKEACEILTDYTREFFEYAKKKGCVGEFVEDIKEKKIELPEWYRKINKILSLFVDKNYIDKKYIDIIHDTIYDYAINYKIRHKCNEIVVMTKGTYFQYARYMMASCYYAIYGYKDDAKNKENWSCMCACLFDQKINTWRQHWNDSNDVDDETQRRIREIINQD